MGRVLEPHLVLALIRRFKLLTVVCHHIDGTFSRGRVEGKRIVSVLQAGGAPHHK